MSPIFTGSLTPEPEDTGVSTGRVGYGTMLGTVASQTLAESPVAQLAGIGEIARAERAADEPFESQLGRVMAGESPADVLDRPQRPMGVAPPLPIAEARERVKREGLEKDLRLPDGPDIRPEVLDIMIDRARIRREREATIARGPDGIVPGVLSVGTSLLVGALDPINVGSAFIPVVGEARFASLMASAGTGTLARAGVRAGVGAAEGAVGMAMLQPLDWYARTQEGQDWTMATGLRNVMFGAGLGAGLRSGGGAVADVFRGRAGRPLYPFAPGEAAAPAPVRSADLPGTAAPETVETASAALLDDAAAGRSIDEAHDLVFADLAGRLRDTGLPADQAEANAAIVAANYTALAEQTGRQFGDALDLYRADHLEVKRTGPASPAEVLLEEMARAFDQRGRLDDAQLDLFRRAVDELPAQKPEPYPTAEPEPYPTAEREPRPEDVWPLDEAAARRAMTSHLSAETREYPIAADHIIALFRRGASDEEINAALAAERIRRRAAAAKYATWHSSFLQSAPKGTPAPPFYSAVARAIEVLNQPKASPDQWLATIKNKPGVKPEELEWLGLADWLKGQRSSVTKDQLLDYVRANQIEVKEVQKPVPPDPAAEARVRKISRQIAELRRSNAPDAEARIEELVGERLRLDRLAEGEEPKYEQYTVPGGEDYRELLLTLAPKEKDLVGYEEFAAQTLKLHPDLSDADIRESYRIHRSQGAVDGIEDYTSGHWDEPNIVAHVRFNERTIDGKRTLFVEEVQSDWHQAGKKRGYQTAGAKKKLAQLEAEAKTAGAEARKMVQREDNLGFDTAREAMRVLASEDPAQWDLQGADLAIAQRWHEAARKVAIAKRMVGEAVPDAPFKTTWPELVMKRMIRWAAENGYDKIAWAPGDVQAGRYDLSKQIGRVEWTRSGTGGFDSLDAIEARHDGIPVRGTIRAFNHDGREVLSKHVDETELPDIVGKEVADKLLAARPQRIATGGVAKSVRELSGLDLKVGGEGMRAFYDQQLPIVVNKLVKKYGAKVGKEALDYDAPRDFGDSFVVRNADGAVAFRGPLGDAERYAERYGGEAEYEATPSAEALQVPTLDITPELRRVAVEQGFSLFQRRPEPIAARLTGRELGDTPTFRALRDAAYRWYEDHLVRTGLTVKNEATGFEIRFSGRGLRKTTRSGEDLLPLVPALPDLLRKATLLDSSPDAKGRADVSAVHRFAAAAELNGQRTDVVLVVRETKDGKFHYSLHKDRDFAPGAGRSSQPRGGTLDQGVAPNALEGAPGDLNIALREPEGKVADAGEARGRITFAQGRTMVDLFERADASTFVHEMGHLFLEQRIRYAGLVPESSPLRQDLATVMKWLGVERPEDIATVHHEQFARGFETYLAEGKAPSEKLAGVFARFKQWLLAIYRAIADIGSPIDDDVRAVFDRMLATEPELARRPAPIVQALADLPPQAKQDAMRAAIAAVVEGEPVRVGEMLDAAAQTDPRIAESMALASDDADREFLRGMTGDTAPAATAARGPRARPAETWSLLEFIASRGGIDPEDRLAGDVRQSIGRKNKFVPGFGNLLRKGGMRLDRAREAAVEAGYLVDRGAETGGEASTTIRTLLDAMDEELRGQRVYRSGHLPEASKRERGRLDEDNRIARERALDDALSELGTDTNALSESQRRRIIEIMEREGVSDPHEAMEREALEWVQDAADDGQAERIADDIPGWDAPDAGPAAAPGRAPAAVEGSGSSQAGGDVRPVGGPAGTPSGAGEVAVEQTAAGAQIVLPGAEQSARQLAVAREAGGRGRMTPAVPQKDPGGLFGPKPSDQPDLWGQLARPRAGADDPEAIAVSRAAAAAPEPPVEPGARLKMAQASEQLSEQVWAIMERDLPEVDRIRVATAIEEARLAGADARTVLERGVGCLVAGGAGR